MANHTAGDVIAGRYRLDIILGRGGFGITWRGVDLQTQGAVAIKELAIRAVEQWRAIELFEREARVLKNLDDPHIPAYVDFITPTASDDAFVLVQGLAPGSSLADLVKSGWRATEADARDIARQVLETLVYLHAFSPPVVHRDLKPQNLIRGDDGNIMVVDFGSVRDTLASESELGSVAGTFGYMAPEQFAGRALPVSDLYSLGATLVHVLSHRSPAELPQRELRLDFRPFVQISPSFTRFIDRLLDPIPERRFASAKAALHALDEPQSDLGQRPSVLSERVQIDYDDAHLIVALKASTTQGGGVRIGFAIVWLSFVGFWVTTAVSMGAPIIFPLFSIPFWIVGFGMLRSGLRSVGGRSRIDLSPSGVDAERRIFRFRTKRDRVALEVIEDFSHGPGGKVFVHIRRPATSTTPRVSRALPSTATLAVAELPGGADAELLADALREHLTALRALSPADALQDVDQAVLSRR